MAKLTLEELEKVLERNGYKISADTSVTCVTETLSPKKKDTETSVHNKYRNTPVVDSALQERFDSKLEEKHAKEFRARLRAEEFIGYSRQVTLQLPGNIQMRVDHLLIHADGKLEFIDTKGGIITRDWRMKQKLAKSCLGITVEIKK